MNKYTIPLNFSDFCVTMKLISAAAVHRWNNFWSSRSSSYKIWQLLQKGGGKSSQSVCAVVDELSIWQKMTSLDICQDLLSYIYVQSDVIAVSNWFSWTVMFVWWLCTKQESAQGNWHCTHCTKHMQMAAQNIATVIVLLTAHGIALHVYITIP